MIYRYRAENGSTAELQLSIHDDIPAVILDETGMAFRRVYEAPGIVYKGTGFYTTDKSDSIDRWRRENLDKD